MKNLELNFTNKTITITYKEDNKTYKHTLDYNIFKKDIRDSLLDDIRNHRNIKNMVMLSNEIIGRDNTYMTPNYFIDYYLNYYTIAPEDRIPRDINIENKYLDSLLNYISINWDYSPEDLWELLTGLFEIKSGDKIVDNIEYHLWDKYIFPQM